MYRFLLAVGIAGALVRTVSVAQEARLLPNRPDSLKFAAIGDNGTGAAMAVAAARMLRVGRFA